MFLVTRKGSFLDIRVHGLEELSGLYFDVTVRHPRDARYSPSLCATTDGIALQRAAAEDRPGIRRAPRGVL